METAKTLSAQRLQTIFLAFLALIGFGFLMFILRELVLGVVIALLFSLIFKPLLQLLRRHGVPRALAVLVVIMCVLALMTLVGYIMFTGVQTMVEEAPKYQERLNTLAKDALGLMARTLKGFGRQAPQLNPADWLQFSSVAAFITASVGTVLNFLENVVLILLFLIFLLSGSEDFQVKLGRAFSSENYDRFTGMLTEINHEVRRYIVMKTLINLGVGALTTVLLLAFHVDFALLIGLVTFLMNYIPNFGALIATVLPATVAFLQFDSIGIPILVVALLIVIHNLVGNLVEPKVLGESLDLSPLLVLLALIFWGWIWGILGMVLAVPITSIIKIICKNIPVLKPMAVLMSTGTAGKKGQGEAHARRAPEARS